MLKQNRADCNWRQLHRCTNQNSTSSLILALAFCARAFCLQSAHICDCHICYCMPSTRSNSIHRRTFTGIEKRFSSFANELNRNKCDGSWIGSATLWSMAVTASHLRRNSICVTPFPKCCTMSENNTKLNN